MDGPFRHLPARVQLVQAAVLMTMKASAPAIEAPTAAATRHPSPSMTNAHACPRSPGAQLGSKPIVPVAGLWNLTAGFIAPWSVMPWWIRWFWCAQAPLRSDNIMT